MQDRYVADVGDFGKYALLRALVSPALQLGVVWYANPDEEGNRDGGITHYPELRECDESLYDTLQMLLRAGKRRMADIEQAGVLPSDTAYFARPLTFRDLPPLNLTARRRRREQWLQGALASMSQADVVFLDPDNGFAPDSVPVTSNGAQKCVFLEEVSAFLNRNQSVVVYHHHGHESLLSPIERYFPRLRAAGARHLWALTFRRYSVRTYFIAAASRHADVLLDRSRKFASSLWGQREHFQLRAPNDPWPQGVIAQPAISGLSGSQRRAAGTPRSEVCEILDGKQWKTIGIDDALEIRRQRGRWPGGRCVECNQRVRPHKLGTTGQRAHFEHLTGNPSCSRSYE